MTKRLDLDDALRRAAAPAGPRTHQPAARNLLDDILRSDPTAADGPVTMAVRSRRRKPLLAAAAFTLVVAAVSAVVTDDTDRAYASWTTAPSSLSASDADAVMAACLPPGTPGAHVAIGERRGEYAYINVQSADGNVTCFRDHDGRVFQTSIREAPTDVADLGATGIELYAGGQLRTAEGYARLMAGRLGSQVTAVEITVRPGTSLRATVTGGYFAAWYPEGLAESATNNTSLTLHLADGGTVAGLSFRDLMENPRLD